MPMSRLLRRHVRDVLAVDEHLALVGRSSRRAMRSAVVLPQPDGPSRATNSPGSSVEVEAVERPVTPPKCGAARAAGSAGPWLRR